MSEPRLRPVPAVGDHRSPDELLLSTAKGDREAYAALFDHVAPKVVGVCRRVVRDPARSEEVAQEVLTEVWRNAKRFDPDRGSAMTWIMTIAHRRASTASARCRPPVTATNASGTGTATARSTTSRKPWRPGTTMTASGRRSNR